MTKATLITALVLAVGLSQTVFAKKRSNPIVQEIKAKNTDSLIEPVGILVWKLEVTKRSSELTHWKTLREGSHSLVDCKGCVRGVSFFGLIGFRLDGDSIAGLVLKAKNTGVKTLN